MKSSGAAASDFVCVDRRHAYPCEHGYGLAGRGCRLGDRAYSRSGLVGGSGKLPAGNFAGLFQGSCQLPQFSCDRLAAELGHGKLHDNGDTLERIVRVELLGKPLADCICQ